MLTEKVTFRFLHMWVCANVCVNQNVYVYMHTNACSNNHWGSAVNWKDWGREMGEGLEAGKRRGRRCNYLN